MDENVICDVCGKDRKNLCDTNWERHLKSCKEKNVNKKIKELEKKKIMKKNIMKESKKKMLVCKGSTHCTDFLKKQDWM